MFCILPNIYNLHWEGENIFGETWMKQNFFHFQIPGPIMNPTKKEVNTYWAAYIPGFKIPAWTRKERLSGSSEYVIMANIVVD